jgi:NifU-like protein involved in Fe-S cluster formation
MPDADRFGLAGFPGDGAYVKLWLKTKEGEIIQATYETNCCPSSMACSSALCELSVGRNMEIMMLLEANELVTYLGGLPEGKDHYADLAIQAMRDAIRGDGQ